MIYFIQYNFYDMKFICTGNEIDLSQVSDLTFLHSFSQNILSWSKLTITDNYICPYERSRFQGIMNLNGCNFERDNYQCHQQDVPDFIYEGHKEDEIIKEKIVHIGSSEKTTLVKIVDCVFKDFKSDGDGGLFYLKDIKVQCENSKITGCESINGGGGGIYIKNTNDQSANVSIKNAQFSKCVADYGGALYVYTKSKNINVVVDSCIFNENVAKDTSGTKIGGSAIYISIAKGEIVSCQFKKNYGSSILKYIYDRYLMK